MHGTNQYHIWGHHKFGNNHWHNQQFINSYKSNTYKYHNRFNTFNHSINTLKNHCINQEFVDNVLPNTDMDMVTDDIEDKDMLMKTEDFLMECSIEDLYI